MKKIITAGMVTALSMTAHATGNIHVPNGFMNGNAYQQFSDLEKRRYIAGVMDGFYFSGAFLASDAPRPLKLQACVINHKMNDGQVEAIVNKYLSDHPEQWGEEMGAIVYWTMLDACAKVGTPIN